MADSIHQRAREVTDAFETACKSDHPAPASDLDSLDPWEEVEDAYARFRLWAGNLGASHPSWDSKSLDHRLRAERAVAHRIRDSLLELTDLLTRFIAWDPTKAADADVKIGDGANEIDEFLVDFLDLKTSPSCELSWVTASIADAVRHLFKISRLIEKSTTRDRYARAEATADCRFTDQFDLAHVHAKYDTESAEPWLLDRLGKAITKRRTFLKYSREHRDRLDGVLHLDEARVHAQTLPQDVPAQDQMIPSVRPSQISKPSQQQTAASTLGPIDTSFVDDGFDDDDRSRYTKATSISDGRAPDRLRVVKLEDVATVSEPFQCPYCCTVQKFNGQLSWERHVFSDLRAYICTFEGCGMTMFSKKRDWVAHEMEKHRRQWQCQLCARPSFPNEEALLTHMSHSHATAMTTGATCALLRTSSRPLGSIRVRECPLCDWDRIMKGVNPQTAGSGDLTVPSQRFMKHLAGHLEELALFAVPRGGPEDHSSDAGDSIDVSHRGRGGAVYDMHGYIDTLATKMPVVSAAQLEFYSTESGPFERDQDNEPGSVAADGDGATEYEVERLLDRRNIKRCDQLVDVDDLTRAAELMEEYDNRHPEPEPSSEGPPSPTVREETFELFPGPRRHRFVSTDTIDAARARGPHILIVDDDDISSRITNEFLKSFNCSTSIAVDGLEVINLFTSIANGDTDTEKPDLVLMNFAMPGLDGVSATNVIRKLDRTTPIISMTTHTRSDDIAMYFREGMNNVLQKPFTKEHLLKTLETHLQAFRPGEIPGTFTSTLVATHRSNFTSAQFLTDHSGTPAVCPISTCRRPVEDLGAHLLLHQQERPEKCVVPACEYHIKGFARKYDRNRHILTHYKGTMVCAFCPISVAVVERTFNHVDVLKLHMRSVHGVKQTPPNTGRKSRASKYQQRSSEVPGTCLTCGNLFTSPQDFYDHLDNCIIRVLQQVEEVSNEELLSLVEDNEQFDGTVEENERSVLKEQLLPEVFRRQRQVGSKKDLQSATKQSQGDEAPEIANSHLDNDQALKARPLHVPSLSSASSNEPDITLTESYFSSLGVHPDADTLYGTKGTPDIPTTMASAVSAMQEDVLTFLQILAEIAQSQGRRFDPRPTIGGKVVDLYALWREVMSSAGGSAQLERSSHWQAVAENMGFSQIIYPTAAKELRDIWSLDIAFYENDLRREQRLYTGKVKNFGTDGMGVNDDLTLLRRSVFPLQIATNPQEDSGKSQRYSSEYIPFPEPLVVQQFSDLFDRSVLYHTFLEEDYADWSTVEAIFKRIALPTDVTNRAWVMASQSRAGLVNRPEFILAMYVLESIASQTIPDVPEIFPREVYYAIRSHLAAQVDRTPLTASAGIEDAFHPTTTPSPTMDE